MRSEHIFLHVFTELFRENCSLIVKIYADFMYLSISAACHEK